MIISNARRLMLRVKFAKGTIATEKQPFNPVDLARTQIVQPLEIIFLTPLVIII